MEMGRVLALNSVNVVNLLNSLKFVVVPDGH